MAAGSPGRLHIGLATMASPVEPLAVSVVRQFLSRYAMRPMGTGGWWWSVVGKEVWPVSFECRENEPGEGRPAVGTPKRRRVLACLLHGLVFPSLLVRSTLSHG